MSWLRRILQEEPARVGVAAAAVYACARMLYQALVAKEAPVEIDVVVAAVAALWSLYVRGKVTPLARPRDGKGRALKPSQQ